MSHLNVDGEMLRSSAWGEIQTSGRKDVALPVDNDGEDETPIAAERDCAYLCFAVVQSIA